jgi:hypothetical protein
MTSRRRWRPSRCNQIGAGLRREKDLLFPGDARVFETTALFQTLAWATHCWTGDDGEKTLGSALQ